MANVATGAPTKEFFVEMLTRDIDLSDAILDLLDNCLDGVVRQKGAVGKLQMDYYKDFSSNIYIKENSFTIEDNCGGIPRDVAEKYAFRMGSSYKNNSNKLPTVGIYGIGMKRAIFKIGESAQVLTRNNNSLYKVKVPLNWAVDETNWDFPIEEITDSELLKSGGTKIEITNLNQEIADKWSNKEKCENYCEHLIKAIQESYSFIIQKGFEIKVNDKKVTPLSTELLMAENLDDESIKPFLYKQTFDDVVVNLAIGFYAPPPSQEEIDDENTLKRSSADAGWTVICNDRVVLYNDKSHLTGWGESGVPQYHTQFIGIRGIVFFESNNPKSLPMTTTKRGIDASSKIYSAVKDRMRQGMKIFTDYTNRWKGQNEKERVYSTATKPIAIDSFMGSKDEVEKNTHVNFSKSKGGFVSIPRLPQPTRDKPYKVIRFSKNYEDILDITEYFFKDRDHPVTPSQIGEKCFDKILLDVRQKEKC